MMAMRRQRSTAVPMTTTLPPPPSSTRLWVFAAVVLSLLLYCESGHGLVPLAQSHSAPRRQGRLSELHATTAAPPPLFRDRWQFQFGNEGEASSSIWTNVVQRTRRPPPRVFDFVRNKDAEEQAYQRRKDLWAAKYTSLEALRENFGGNQRPWGDLPAQTARRLYKSLLPKALLELHALGVRPEDLAPLAYRARLAAKLYARERCRLPSRWAAQAYDGIRQFKRCGKFQIQGMSYQQIWDKYHKLIMEEEEDLTDADATAKISLKILERSCHTNEMVDNLVMRKKKNRSKVNDEKDAELLQELTETLDRDVRRLLQPVVRSTPNRKILRNVLRIRRRFKQGKNEDQ